MIQQNRFFVVRLPDGTFLNAYNSKSQAPKMYVRIGDARRWANTREGAEVIAVCFFRPESSPSKGIVLGVKETDDDNYRGG